MAKREPTAIVQLKIRMRETLRSQIEAAAGEKGISINAETVDRLERTFTEDDDAGGPEVRNIGRLMAAAFMRGGQRGAHAAGHSDWTPAEWMNDPFAYEVAVLSVLDVLYSAYPHDPSEEKLTDAQREERGKHRTMFAREVARGNRSVNWTREDETESES